VASFTASNQVSQSMKNQTQKTKKVAGHHTTHASDSKLDENGNPVL